jgi:cytolysin (calcineurin-like family phosphatase)
MIKVDIIMDTATRTGYVPLIEPVPEYETYGTFSVLDGDLQGTYWISADGQQITNLSRLGTSSYQVYDLNGAPVAGMTQSGITADANGLYRITNIASTLDLDHDNYYVKISTTVDGLVRTNFLSILATPKAYKAKAIFSINALNQLQATLWLEEGDSVKKGVGLGTASYQVYDSAGVAVGGLTQSGITADVNGRFQITPVAATLLTDLTHFSVRVSIIADGSTRESYIGMTLLGT